MNGSVNPAASSTLRKSIDDVQTKPLRYGAASQSTSIRLTPVVKAALQRHYGSLKSAAISLRIDLGQLSRELESGDFKLEKLDRADDEAKAYVAAALHEACAGKTDPRARINRLIREARERLDDLAEAVG